MTGVKGDLNSDMADSVKAVKTNEAEGQFLKSKGDGIDETDEEEDKDLNSAFSESVVHIKSDDKTSGDCKGIQEIRKGILKHQRTFSNKHVDFNMDVQFVPFDESKDFTIEIQIVEQMPKKVISYAALFAQQALEEEERKRKDESKKAKKKSQPKKHCVNCKKSKDGIKKVHSSLAESIEKCIDPDEADKINKETGELESTPSEAVCSLPGAAEKSFQEGNEANKNSELPEEMLEDSEECECHNEDGRHNEDDCSACQNYIFSQNENEECEISNTNMPDQLNLEEENYNISISGSTEPMETVTVSNKSINEMKGTEPTQSCGNIEIKEGLVSIGIDTPEEGKNRKNDEDEETKDQHEIISEIEGSEDIKEVENVNDVGLIEGKDTSEISESNSKSKTEDTNMQFLEEMERSSFEENVNTDGKVSSKSYEVSADTASEVDCESLSADTEEFYTDSKNDYVEQEQELCSLSEQSEEYNSENPVSKDDEFNQNSNSMDNEENNIQDKNDEKNSTMDGDESLNESDGKSDIDTSSLSDGQKYLNRITLQPSPINEETSGPSFENTKDQGNFHKQDHLVQNKDKYEETINELLNQDLVEKYPASLEEDRHLQIKSDGSNVQTFSKMESNSSSINEINNSR